MRDSRGRFTANTTVPATNVKFSNAAMQKLEAIREEAKKEDKIMTLPTITIENVYLPNRPVVYYNAEGRLVKLTTPHISEDGSKVWEEVICADYQLIVKTDVGDKHVIQLTNGLIDGMNDLYNPLQSFMYKAMSQYNAYPYGTDEEYNDEDVVVDLKYMLNKAINVKVTTKTKTSKSGKEYTKTYFSPIYSKRDRLAETSDL